MMGSPEDEPERYDDELQHEVILTQGFWLGGNRLHAGIMGSGNRQKSKQIQRCQKSRGKCKLGGLYKLHS